MFKFENTGMPAWKKIVDDEGKHIADLDELYSGDWGITELNSFNRIVSTPFSNGSKAVNWLWKNRHDLGEPFNSYADKEKPTKKAKKPEPVVIEEEPSEDLFWDYKIK